MPYKISLFRRVLLFVAVYSASTPNFAVTTIADIAEVTIPSVVNIRTKSTTGTSSNLNVYDFFMNGMVPDKAVSQSVGSGVIVDAEGYILTSLHVIEDAASIEVLLAHQRKKFTAQIMGRDKKTDLALLKIKTNLPLAAAKFGSSDALRIGETVIAIGNPFGYSHTVTSGIISAKGRVLGTGPLDSFLQTDAAINPGNSGGPLINLQGEVIGINSAIDTQGAGIGFAIPSNLAKRVLLDLKQHGQVRRPWLGIQGKNILSRDFTDQASDQTVLEQDIYGVVITDLVVGGPAHKSGLHLGDLIMGINKEAILDQTHFQQKLYQLAPGATITIKYYRRQKGFRYTTATLKEVPAKVSDQQF